MTLPGLYRFGNHIWVEILRQDDGLVIDLTNAASRNGVGYFRAHSPLFPMETGAFSTRIREVTLEHVGNLRIIWKGFELPLTRIR